MEHVGLLTGEVPHCADGTKLWALGQTLLGNSLHHFRAGSFAQRTRRLRGLPLLLLITEAKYQAGEERVPVPVKQALPPSCTAASPILTATLGHTPDCSAQEPKHQMPHRQDLNPRSSDCKVQPSFVPQSSPQKVISALRLRQIAATSSDWHLPGGSQLQPLSQAGAGAVLCWDAHTTLIFPLACSGPCGTTLTLGDEGQKERGSCKKGPAFPASSLTGLSLSHFFLFLF